MQVLEYHINWFEVTGFSADQVYNHRFVDFTYIILYICCTNSSATFYQACVYIYDDVIIYDDGIFTGSLAVRLVGVFRKTAVT